MRNLCLVIFLLTLLQLPMAGCTKRTPNYFGPGILRGSGEGLVSGENVLGTRTSALMRARRDLYDRLMKHNLDKDTTIGDIVAEDEKAEEKMWSLVRKAQIIEEEKTENSHRIELEIDLLKAERLIK